MTEKMMQTTNTVLMVRPASFRANPETMQSNHFQKPVAQLEDPSESARREFDAYAAALEKAGIAVRVYEDCPDSGTPDAIFPNNWLAMLEDGSVFTFPMEAPNRRRERRKDILSDLFQEYQVTRHIDLSLFELEQRYLEGTGSLILDHEHRIAYVCCSSRSAEAPGREFEKLSGYRLHWFSAHDRDLRPVYHTNVMMSLGKRFAIVCLESIPSFRERRLLTETLRATGKTLIDVTFTQMESFCCNVLELHDSHGMPVYAMSKRAWRAFSPEQQAAISAYARTVLAPINVIEDLGGGGARCMIAEIFLSKNQDRGT